MTIDFFVHPEHALQAGYENTAGHQRYLERLHQKLMESSCPVLISGLESGEFDKSFRLDQTVRSASHYIVDIPIDQGEVNPKDWQKFIELIKHGSEYKVHGCFFGQCAEGFAVQLFAHLIRNEHWHNWLGDENGVEEGTQKKFRREHEKRGDFAKCGISYGLVLEPPRKTIALKRPAYIKWLSRYPEGNITYQLMGKDTELFRV